MPPKTSEPLKTSESDPIRVDFVADLDPLRGRIGMTFAPGKRAPGIGGEWHRDVEQDLERLCSEYGASTLVSLLEPDERRHLGIEDICQRARARRLTVLELPIPDGGIPSSMSRTYSVASEIAELVRQGQTVIVHCRGGLGRTGLIAACALCVLGRRADEAIRAVRAARHGAVEHHGQEGFVREFAAFLPSAAATKASRARGCLLGGAVGDALGAPVEFLSDAEIQARFGPGGVSGYEPAYGRAGAITDDTQMTLFTAEGLIRAQTRAELKGICDVTSVIHHAYLRWLHTQGVSRLGSVDGWLVAEEALHQRRAPGNTCLSALQATRLGHFERVAPNTSKGCGGVMRVAPLGLMGPDAFRLGCEAAAVTHGHPTGYVAAGFLASIIAGLLEGRALRVAAETSLAELPSSGAPRAETEETEDAVRAALDLSDRDRDATVSRLGQGWVAEEALAMGLFAALTAKDFRHGVLRAVNHGGDSDSTGSIAGNLLGAHLGREAIPDDLLEHLEARDVIEQVANDLVARFVFQSRSAEADWDRYPGW